MKSNTRQSMFVIRAVMIVILSITAATAVAAQVERTLTVLIPSQRPSDSKAPVKPAIRFSRGLNRKFFCALLSRRDKNDTGYEVMRALAAASQCIPDIYKEDEYTRDDRGGFRWLSTPPHGASPSDPIHAAGCAVSRLL